MIGMENKVAVVTGACGAIGRGIAFALARAGAKVVENDVGVSLTGAGGDSNVAKLLVQEITDAGGQAVANSDSVFEWTGASRVVACAVDHFGRIDAVINNAGNLRDRFFFNMNEDEWAA